MAALTPPVVMLDRRAPVREMAPAIDAAAEALQAGGMVVLPTDTVYGVAVRAEGLDAASRLAAAKDRPEEQAIAVLVSNVDQAAALGQLPPGSIAARLAGAFWPGPLTLVVDRNLAGASATLQLGGDETSVGIRCPDDAFIEALTHWLGPLATTSANRHGEPTPPDAPSAAAALVVPPDLVVDGGPCGGTPSTVVDVRGDEMAVLRLGAITAEQLQAVLS